MASAIDSTQPPEIAPTTAAMRANMSAAKAEIEALQLQVSTESITIIQTATTDVSMATGTYVPFTVITEDLDNRANIAQNEIIVPQGTEIVQISFNLRFLPPTTATKYVDFTSHILKSSVLQNNSTMPLRTLRIPALEIGEIGELAPINANYDSGLIRVAALTLTAPVSIKIFATTSSVQPVTIYRNSFMQARIISSTP
jgi:hypothetical protein